MGVASSRASVGEGQVQSLQGIAQSLFQNHMHEVGTLGNNGVWPDGRSVFDVPAGVLEPRERSVLDLSVRNDVTSTAPPAG